MSRPSGYRDRPWIPRFWDGMIAWGWFPLLWRNRFRVSPQCWRRAAVTSAASLFNSVLWAIQIALLGHRIKRTRLVEDPIFVIGHWRTGTTLLHELLALDPRYTYPNTYDCFAPNHFLISGWLLRPLLGLLLPKQRPMDAMAVAWDHPQEDEYALCNMGVPSSYLTILFPNHPPQYQEYLDLERISPRERSRWQRGLWWFLRCVTWRNPRRIVLKSPQHTCRIKSLLEMFPDARFVHITRHPFVVFPSTVHLWRRLYLYEGLQTPNFEGLEEYVFETFNRMYERFEQDRRLLAPSRLCEVRYEELVADPIGQMRRIYERLELGEFEQVRPALEQYFAAQAGYQTNRYVLSPETRAEIRRRWGWFLEQYGYDVGTAAG